MLNLKHCLPDCEETSYTATTSAAPFQNCDFRNVEINSLCDLQMYGYDNTSFVINNPPIWGRNVMEEYRKVANVKLKFKLDHL